jgi:hypothetical protein
MAGDAVIVVLAIVVSLCSGSLDRTIGPDAVAVAGAGV